MIDQYLFPYIHETGSWNVENDILAITTHLEHPTKKATRKAGQARDHILMCNTIPHPNPCGVELADQRISHTYTLLVHARLHAITISTMHALHCNTFINTGICHYAIVIQRTAIWRQRQLAVHELPMFIIKKLRSFAFGGLFQSLPLLWRHNGHDSVSNHNCLINRLFGCKSKKTSKLYVTGFCAGNSPGTGEFPAQMASNAENVSIWCHHHGTSSK